MAEAFSDTPTTIQVGGVTVRSLEPRRPAAKGRYAADESLLEEARFAARTSADRTEASAQGGTGEHAGSAEQVDHFAEVAGAGKPGRQEDESDYNFCYLENQKEDLVEAKRAEKRGFAYRNHPADVVLHSWGSSLAIAFQRAGLALFNYMTDIELIQPKHTRNVIACGSDLKSLLYSFLTELLNLYGEDYFMASDIHIESIDKHEFKIVAEARGDKFDPTRHTMGTEVKAITMHDMGIWQKNIVPGLSTCGDHDIEEHEKDRGVEIFVVVDI